MGRTNPTYRDRLDALEREWESYRRGLRADERPHFDRLWEQAREYAHAAGYHNAPTPAHPLFVSIVLAHERRLRALERRLDDAQTNADAGGTGERGDGHEGAGGVCDGVQD